MSKNAKKIKLRAATPPLKREYASGCLPGRKSLRYSETAGVHITRIFQIACYFLPRLVSRLFHKWYINH